MHTYTFHFHTHLLISFLLSLKRTYDANAHARPTHDYRGVHQNPAHTQHHLPRSPIPTPSHTCSQTSDISLPTRSSARNTHTFCPHAHPLRSLDLASITAHHRHECFLSAQSPHTPTPVHHQSVDAQHHCTRPIVHLRTGLSPPQKHTRPSNERRSTGTPRPLSFT
ncbi:hypothetical protein FIBSPDRAFT_851081, partial [Athelia psychrophila]